MTEIDPYYVGAYEHGLIRIYVIDLPPDQVPLFATEQSVDTPDYNWSLKDWLGADPLNSTHIAVFDIADLGDMGLVGYLREGHNVAQAEIVAYRSALEQITGAVAVITSSAFDGAEQILTPPDEAPLAGKNPLRHIMTLKEEGANVTFKPLPDESAKRPVDDAPKRKAPSDAAMSGRVATMALLVMAVLVWIMIRIAG